MFRVRSKFQTYKSALTRHIWPAACCQHTSKQLNSDMILFFTHRLQDTQAKMTQIKQKTTRHDKATCLNRPLSANQRSGRIVTKYTRKNTQKLNRLNLHLDLNTHATNWKIIQNEPFASGPQLLSQCAQNIARSLLPASWASWCALSNWRSAPQAMTCTLLPPHPPCFLLLLGSWLLAVASSTKHYQIKVHISRKNEKNMLLLKASLPRGIQDGDDHQRCWFVANWRMRCDVTETLGWSCLEDNRIGDFIF